jgi:hypothetical protein
MVIRAAAEQVRLAALQQTIAPVLVVLGCFLPLQEPHLTMEAVVAVVSLLRTLQAGQVV